MSRNTNSILGSFRFAPVLGLLAGALMAVSTQAATININWTHKDDGTSDYTGEGILTVGDADGIWNNVYLDTNPEPNVFESSGTSLLDSDGNTTPVSFTQTAARYLYPTDWGRTGHLYSSGLINNSDTVPTSIVITGLTAGEYKVAAMAVRGQGGGQTSFYIGGDTANSKIAGTTDGVDITDMTGTIQFPAGSDINPTYWVIFDVTVDSSGSFTLNALQAPANGTNPATSEAPINAMQIQAVPEPAGALLLGLGGLALIRRRRA